MLRQTSTFYRAARRTNSLPIIGSGSLARVAVTLCLLLLPACDKNSPLPTDDNPDARNHTPATTSPRPSDPVAAAATHEVPTRQLASIPGVEDRSDLAPLAYLFAKADPSADPEWLSEQFSVHAGDQLARLGHLLNHSQHLRADQLTMLASAEYSSLPIRPETTTVYQDDVLAVARAKISDQQPTATLVGREGLAAGLRAWAEPYAATGEDAIHIKFKVIRVVLDKNSATTVARVEASGPAATSADHHAQQSALWTCSWHISEQADVPLLTSIDVSEYEEVLPVAASHFVDYTEAMLGANPSFEQQLRYGADHWYGNLDVAFGIHHGNQGLALGDANGDGREDLFVCQPAGLPCLFYLQQGDGTLKDATVEAGLNWLDVAHSALFFDCDNDGDQDLAVTLNYSVVIFENLGEAKFYRRTQIDIHSWPSSLAAADFDNDGDLDLFACGYNPRGETAPGDVFANPVPYHDANNGARNFMMRYDGNWLFSDVTADCGLNQNNHRFTFAATWEDYDNDGDMDLYVANDFGRNNLYRNDLGNDHLPHFTDVAAEAGVEDIAAGMSVSWADYNHDGWMDLYVSNMFSSAGNRITTQQQFKSDDDSQTRTNLQRHARGNSLFENMKDGTFRDVSEQANVTLGRWAWGSLFTDINNDGWEDIYVVNGFFTTEDTGDL